MDNLRLDIFATGQFATFAILVNPRLSLWSIYDFHFRHTHTMFIKVAMSQDERGVQGIHTFYNTSWYKSRNKYTGTG